MIVKMAKYKKSLGASLIKHNDDFIILKNRSVFKVNEVGARIFELCNDDNDEMHIIEKLSKFYNIEEKEIDGYIKDFIGEMLNMNIIKIITQG
jgi:hypothetical protein